MQNGTPTSIYKYFDEYGVLIYVGITNGGIRRQREHNKDKSWWQYVASQTIEHHDSREAALARESQLIETHQPPFNTQHNPNHRAAQASYSTFRKLPDLDRSPIDIVRDYDRTIPLMIVSREAQEMVLATPLRFASLVHIIQADSKLRAIAGNTRCGHLRRLRVRGPSLEFILDVRADVEPLDPVLTLGIVMGKNGATFTARNIHVSKHNPSSTRSRKDQAERRIIKAEYLDEASK